MDGFSIIKGLIMPSDKSDKLEEYFFDGADMDADPQSTLSEIVGLVKLRLYKAMDDTNSVIANTHPRTLISMVVTNILVNLLTDIIGPKEPSIRIEMVNDSLDEICIMAMNLWRALEANKAEVNTTPH